MKTEHRTKLSDDPIDDPLAGLTRAITRTGFAFVPVAAMRPLVGAANVMSDWEAFTGSWNDLLPDVYLPDGHRYRRRRHATLSARAGDTAPRVEPHRPHYQSLDYNPLVGGIERWFEPIRAEIIAGPTMQHVVALGCRLFGALRPAMDWHIECHQFRIVHDLDGRLLGSFTLAEPFDAALVDDARVKHGVTAVTASDPARPAYRDVLVVTFRALPEE
jgi:hypothetical protein